MKKLKRMFAIVICVAMCFMVNLYSPVKVLNASAATRPTSGSWIDAGNYTEDWVSSVTGQDVYGNQGTASDPYEIRNEKDLAGLSYCSNNLEMRFTDKYIDFTATELDMSRHYWTSIGTSNPIFGTINGNGCIISNLYIGSAFDYEEDDHIGLFGQSYADINNINVQNFRYFVNGYNTGGLLGSWESGSIDGCSAQGVIYNYFDTCCIGGLIGIGQVEEGDSLGEVTNCSADVEIGSYVNIDPEECSHIGWVGGLIGCIASETKVSNCTVDSQIEVGDTYYVGGLVGLIEADTEISNCSGTSYITANNNCSVNSFIGKSRSCFLTISDCSMSGSVFSGDDE